MDILINETPVDFDYAGKTIRVVVQEVDRELERINHVITGVSVNSTEIHTDFDKFAEQVLKSEDKLTITTEAVSELNAKAIEIVLKLLMLVEENQELTEVREAWENFTKTFFSFFSAEECSFLENLGTMIKKPEETGAAERMKRCRELSLFFKERLDECVRPVEALNSAEQLFLTLKAELSNTSVLLQTGKEAQAIKNITLLIEIINKVTRIMPEYFIALRIAEEPIVNGEPLLAFFGHFNANLNDLIASFENKDTVLLGDLIEYEILPKLEALFTSLKTYQKQG